MAALKIGIAGLGFGLDVHLPAIHGLPGVEVTGMLGHDPAHAAEVASKTGLAVSTNLEAWLDASFDAVSLALPPIELGHAVAAALDRGLPILAEKPLGPDYGTACRLAARAAAQPNAIDFEFAELETFVALYDTIHTGLIGRPRHVSVQWLMESRAHRARRWSWKTDMAQHGGVLTLLGTHVFYLLEWLVDPVARLQARLDSQATAAVMGPCDAAPAEDFVHMVAEHRGGTVSSITIGNAAPGTSVHRWTVVGERGMAILANTSDSLTGFTLNVFGAGRHILRQASEPQAGGDPRIVPFRRLAARFVDAVRSGGRCRPDFSDGARVAALVEAARRSANHEGWAVPDAGMAR